ncbi:hypothetical protein [Marivirga atlantica]|uniref:TonB C-terminal domain-containing protein n=1 Tax=Marivirga atlantica TaxID=1548457 RepID=A0A937DJV3_9BACT|nr:hypothetical protein [Marivirga atlantica]MBL0765289.1 hypothetical protein [Marivirga atlantica]
MKKLLFVLIFSPFLLQAQYFSGQITYKTTIKLKNDSMEIEDIIAFINGDSAIYQITEKHYKSSYYNNGQYTYSYTYNDDTYRMYDDYADKPYITFRDSRKGNTTFYSSAVYKDSTLNILGHPCYLVKYSSDYGNSKTYYSDDIKVNSQDFQGHEVGNWYKKLKEVNGAIAIKTITEHDDYIEIREAVKIEELEFSDSTFNLPEKPITVAFSTLDKEVELKNPSKESINCYQQKVAEASKNGGESYIIYLDFVLDKNGAIQYIHPVDKYDEALVEVAKDILKNCGVEFIPGELNGETVSSEMFFPVGFLR